jgi:hypothetical protein
MGGSVIDDLDPKLRVALAVAPFVTAMILRVIFGRKAWARWIVTLTTMWFAINVLLAPYSGGIRREVLWLGSVFR